MSAIGFWEGEWPSPVRIPPIGLAEFDRLFSQGGVEAIMDTAILDSSFLRRADYDRETRTLTVHMTGGRSYVLHDVPPETFEGLRDDPSPGSYFNREIKGKY